MDIKERLLSVSPRILGLDSARGYRSDLAASLGLRHGCRDSDFAHLPRREWGAALERHAVRNNPTRWAGGMGRRVERDGDVASVQ